MPLQDVLRDTNVKVFDDICRWVYKAFDAIRSSGTPSSSSASRPFPILTRADCKILFTGLVLTSKFPIPKFQFDVRTLTILQLKDI